MSTEELKAALLDSLWGTERGLSASSESRADINELITQLEADSPVSNPAEAQEMLSGTWKLVYTSNSELMALLGLSKLPLVTVHDIKQTINALTGTVVNTLDISVPGSRTEVSATASITVQSPKRVNLKFEKGTISTPQLMTELDLPDETEVMGQRVDLRSVKSAVQPLQEASKGLVAQEKWPPGMQIANFVKSQPDLDLPVPNKASETWLLTTYLDDDLRISRGDMGSIFVLTREVYQVDEKDWAPPAAALPSPTMAEVTAKPGESVSTAADQLSAAAKQGIDDAADAAKSAASTADAAAADMERAASKAAAKADKTASAVAADVQKAADDIAQDVSEGGAATAAELEAGAAEVQKDVDGKKGGKKGGKKSS